MTTHRVATVGGRGAHACVYRDLDRCSLVAVANPTPASGRAFADEHAIDEVFEEHVAMVESVEPDVVSVVTPEPTHAPIVEDVAETDVPGAIHCEKPMADTFGGARWMVEVYDTQTCSSPSIIRDHVARVQTGEWSGALGSISPPNR